MAGKHESPACRIGISYGRTIEEHRLEGVDYYGNTVNTAARLMAANPGGEVFISGFALQDPEARALLSGARVSSQRMRPKGIDEGVTVLKLDPASLAPAKRARGVRARVSSVVDAAVRALKGVKVFVSGEKPRS